MKPRTHDLIPEDDPALRELLVTYLHEQTRGKARVAPPMAARALAADVLLIDLTRSRRDGTPALRILHPRADLSALILKAVESDEGAARTSNANAASDLASSTTPELFARVRALRRAPAGKARAANEATLPAYARFAGWTLELATRRLTGSDGSAITMPHTEFALLVAFLDQPRQTLSRDALAGCIRTGESFTTERTLDVYVSRLRRLLRGGSSGPNVIGTRRNEGYALDADARFE
jgi:two-component system OmpR family response regulator